MDRVLSFEAKSAPTFRSAQLQLPSSRVANPKFRPYLRQIKLTTIGDTLKKLHCELRQYYPLNLLDPWLFHSTGPASPSALRSWTDRELPYRGVRRMRLIRVAAFPYRPSAGIALQ
jgi:hypothetical protein